MNDIIYYVQRGVSILAAARIYSVASMLLAQTQAPSSTSLLRKHRIGGPEYVHVDAKQKGSPVVIAGVSSPSALPSQLRIDWAVKLDQLLAGLKRLMPRRFSRWTSSNNVNGSGTVCVTRRLLSTMRLAVCSF